MNLLQRIHIGKVFVTFLLILILSLNTASTAYALYTIDQWREAAKKLSGIDFTDEELYERYGKENFAPSPPPPAPNLSPFDDKFRTTSTDDQFKAFASQYPDRDPAILQEGYNEIKDRLAARVPA